MKHPMPFNRRAFLKSTLASNVAELKRALQATSDAPLTASGPRPRPGTEGQLVRSALDKQPALEKRPTL